MPFSLLVLALAAAAPSNGPSSPEAGSKKPTLMYTTYFYTAGEAVVHGYEADTKVRVVSMQKGGTIWEGTVGVGETHTVRTGSGVFGFLSDKKAAILVGTPTSCSVVGYFLKDEQGMYRSHRFFTQLPTSRSQDDERVVVWAYEPAGVEVIDRRTEKVLKRAQLPAGGFLQLQGDELVGNRVLEFRSTGAKIAVQVYYDEGFIVPSSSGRGSGYEFLVYVGRITNGVNDLNIVAQGSNAKVKVTDLSNGQTLFSGVVEKGTLHSLTLAQKFVRVTAESPVNVVVAGFKHYQDGYAEHHFGTGIEGMGIDNDFLVTTSGELWLFSYYEGNKVTVTDARSGKGVFTGALGKGAVRGLNPGFGLFRVKSTLGMSVMGGASACGADYSPAAGMFAVDEALFDVIAEVRAERLKEAAARGVTLTPKAAAAPLSEAEWSRYRSRVKAQSNQSLSLDEVNQRAADIQQER